MTAATAVVDMRSGTGEFPAAPQATLMLTRGLEQLDATDRKELS